MRLYFSFLLLLTTAFALAQKKEKTGNAIFLENIPWTEAAKVLTPETVVVIPLGAAAKEHGPHLPLSTDFLQAEYFKQQIAKQRKVVIAPTLNYAFYPPFLKYAGSTSIRLTAGRDMLVEIVRSLAGYGPRRFYVINIGITTDATLEWAAKLLREDGIVLYYSDYLRPSYENAERKIRTQETGTHADEIETSNLLWIRPELTDMTKAADDTLAKAMSGPSLSLVKTDNSRYSPTGIFGYATLATKEKGKRNTDAFTNIMLREIDSVAQCILPKPIDHTSAYPEYAGSYTYDNGKKLVISLVDGKLQYIINGRSMIGFFPLLPYGNDRFCSQTLDMIFLRNDKNEIEKAWCMSFNGQFWAIKEK